MTGKEALNDLKKVVKKFLCNFEKEYTPLDYEKWFYKTKFDKIEKDLQVLELLRKNCFRGYYVDDYVINFEDMTFTELKQIEEWLEDKEDI